MSNTVKNTKKYKGSFFKRLIRESFILSWLNRFLDRIVKLFGSGILYFIFCGSDETDDYLKNGFIGRAFSKINIESRLLRPFKMFVSNGIENSYIVAMYRRIINILISASIRFFGILFCTVGIYGTGIYLAKIFSYITALPNESEIIWSVFLIIAGVPMLISSRSVASVLKTSRFFRLVFIDTLGINEMTLKDQQKAESYGTFAFVLGTVLGLSTVFINPLVIVLTFFVAVILASVLFTPELGLLLAILLFSISSVKVLAIILIITTISFILKVMRAKRNLRFKTADIFVLLFTLYIVAVGIISGSGGQVRALYLICFITVYFLIKNLIVSEKLIRQSLYSLCLGAVAGCLLFVLQYIIIDSQDTYLLALFSKINSSLIVRESFGYFLVMLLPICVALLKIRNRGSEKAGLLVLTALTIVCLIINADSTILTSAYMAVFVYSIFAFKKPIVTSIFFVAITFIFYIISPFVPLLNSTYGVLNVTLTSSGIGKLIIAYIFTGVGMGDHIMIAALNKVGASNHIDSIGLFERLLAEGGIFFLAVFILAAFFILQRAFYCNVRCKNEKVSFITSAFAAVILMFLTLGIFYDMWADIRIYMLFWMICGMVSAIKTVYGRNVYLREDKKSE